MLDAVPAWVCEQCGEAYFEEKEVDTIQDIVRSIEAKAGSLAASMKNVDHRFPAVAGQARIAEAACSVNRGRLCERGLQSSATYS